MPNDELRAMDNSTAAVCECTHVNSSVRERLSHCSHCTSFRRIQWHYDTGTLTLQGSVPTFYLKQVLQTVLRDVEHVRRIDNKVDVVCVVHDDPH